MAKSNGKLFDAPSKLLAADEDSLRLSSELVLTSLTGQRQKLLTDIVSRRPATLLTISGSAFSDPMAESFRTPFLSSDLPSASCGLLDLRPIPSRIKYVLWSPFVKRAARRSVPEDLQSSYFVYRGGRELRGMLDVPNLLGGYAYLLDREGRVRWRACGFASESELEGMFKSIKQLESNT